MPESTRFRRPVLLAAGWTAVLAAAAFFRVFPFVGQVFRGGIVLYENDPYYHLRRILLAVRSWPVVPDFDSWMAYPRGGWCIWPPLFDLPPAGVARATGLDPTLVSIWWPPLLGVLTLVPLFLLARRLFGDLAAWVALPVFAFLPGAVLVSALSRIDHHVAEVLLQVAVLAVFARFLGELEEGRDRPARDGVVLGLLGGVAFGTWAGSQVFLVVPAAVSALLVVARRGTEAARRLVVVQSICWGTTALFALLFGIGNVFRGREAFASHFPSLFQPLLAAVVAIGFPVLLRLVAPLGPRPARSVSLRLAVALSPLLLLAAPAVRGGLSAGLGFLVRSDPWFRTIAEFHPLLASRDTRIYGEIHLGWAMYLLPVGAIVLARRSLARPGFDGRALLGAAWFAHVTALSLLQIRFVFYAAPALAALAGWGVSEAFRKGRGRGLVAAAATALLLWPAIDYWRISIRSAVYPRIDDGLQNLLVHLRNVSPSAGDWYDPDRPPAYSVFADWDLGHWVLGIAERPVVANNFGIHVDPEAWRETARFYGAVKDEGEALSILGAHRSRYLLTKLDLSAPAAGGKWTDLFARRLHLAGGSEEEGLAGSGHFRLVSEAPPMARIGTGPAMRRVGTWRLFEVVAGAKLVCWAAPGTAVEAETRAGSGPEAPRYRRRAVAAPDGRAELLLGWPGRYALRVGGETTELTVPVEAVRSGAEIRLEEPAGRGPS